MRAFLAGLPSSASRIRFYRAGLFNERIPRHPIYYSARSLRCIAVKRRKYADEEGVAVRHGNMPRCTIPSSLIN